jgi:hypothetical protein
VTWTKLDDGFWMHPAIIGVGNVGAGVFARLSLLLRQVPHRRRGPVQCRDDDPRPRGARGAEQILDRMERMRLIDRFESGGVMIVNYLEYNRSRAEVEADREQRRLNGEKGGRPRSSRS